MEEEGESRYDAVSPSHIRGRGGFRATFFLYALTGLENMGVVANMVSLVLYFSYKMYFDLPTSANTLTNLLGSMYLLSVVGGFISDIYIDRFKCCVLFTAVEVLALAMMTIQARLDSLLPKPCGKSSCVESGTAVYFYASLSLLALGAGGLRGALPAFGADQFDPKDPTESKGLASYFNWLLLSSVSGGVLGATVVVYVATNKSNQNWWKGFLITSVATSAGFSFLLAGKRFYRIQTPAGDDSPVTRIAQVLFVAFKNKNLRPRPNDDLHEKEYSSDSTRLAHTDQFGWMDKAAIVPPTTPPTSGRWEVCTVTQVEEVKILARMMPIIASTIVVFTCMAQLQTFSVQQGYRMDGRVGPSFRVPPASIPVIPLVFMVVLIPVYDRLFVPFARKLTGRPSGVTPLQRVGVGLVLSAVSMGVAAAVEVRRRRGSLVGLFWLSFQYGIFGVADMFTLVGLLEFYYKEAPQGMKSMATSFVSMSQAFGYFLSSVFVEVVNSATGRRWLGGQDLDRNRLDLFYWFLAGLSLLNFFNYLFWAVWYKYKGEGGGGAATPEGRSASPVPFLKGANSGSHVVVGDHVKANGVRE